MQNVGGGTRTVEARSIFVVFHAGALGLQPPPEKVVRPPNPPQPPSQEVVGALGPRGEAVETKCISHVDSVPFNSSVPLSVFMVEIARPLWGRKRLKYWTSRWSTVPLCSISRLFHFHSLLFHFHQFLVSLSWSTRSYMRSSARRHHRLLQN